MKREIEIIDNRHRVVILTMVKTPWKNTPYKVGDITVKSVVANFARMPVIIGEGHLMLYGAN